MKTPITHLMIETSVTDDRYIGDYDYCLVEVTPEYVADLLRYIAQARGLHKADETVFCVERWDYEAKYLNHTDQMETLRDIDGNVLCDVHGGEPILLSANPQFPEESFSRVECQTLAVSHDGVWWAAYIKNANVRVETAHITAKTLRRIQRSHRPRLA